MFFLVENTLAARTQVRLRARTNGKSSHGGNAWRNLSTTTFYYPTNLCNLDQSCLDNLADDLRWSIVFLTRSFCANWRTSANNEEGDFSFLRGYEVPQRKTFLSVTYFCSTPFFSLFVLLFSFSPRNACRSLQPACSLLYVYLRCLAKRTLYPLALLYVSICHKSILSLSLYYLTITQIYLSELYTNSPTKINKKSFTLSSQGWASL